MFDQNRMVADLMQNVIYTGFYPLRINTLTFQESLNMVTFNAEKWE